MRHPVTRSATSPGHGRTATAIPLLCASLLAAVATTAVPAGTAVASTDVPAAAIATTAPAAATNPGAVQTLSWPGVNCPDLAGTSALQGDLTQTMNGKLTGCLRVPVVPPGDYYVSLQDILEGTTGPPGPTTSLAPAGPPATLSVSPASAAPGQSVRVTGRLASPLAARSGYGIFCWDGCQGGLVYDGAKLVWSSPTAFSTRLTLPAAPWVEQSPSGAASVVSPVPGPYSLAVECLVNGKGCGLAGPEGQTTVHLRGAAHYTCEDIPGCARLNAPPAVVRPGELVQFSGYAPLESIIGSDYPFAFQLIASTTRPAGPGVTFVRLDKGGVQMDAGSARVKVGAALAFASLRRSRPRAEISAGANPISANPEDPTYVGWCSPGYVEIQGPRGRSQVPLTGATRLLAGTGTFEGPAQDQCDDLALASTGPGSTFAAFEVLPIDQEPMVAEVALFTTDSGRSWSFVPTPLGAKRVSFGGFRYVGHDIDALFSNSAPTPAGRTGPPLVEQTADGGRRWAPVPFSCPSSGPCLTFGAHVPGNCAQGLDSQTVIRSLDKGRQWTEPSWPGGLVTCWLTTLAATSSTQALLVTANTVLSADSPFDALLTDDGGRSWQVVYLPPLPSSQAGEPPQGPGDVVVLPDGGLLSVDSPTWQLLAPGAEGWCAVGTPRLGKGQTETPMSFAVIGERLWWLSASSSGTDVTARDVGAASLTCSP